jgi:hypothetical protein
MSSGRLPSAGQFAFNTDDGLAPRRPKIRGLQFVRETGCAEALVSRLRSLRQRLAGQIVAATREVERDAGRGAFSAPEVVAERQILDQVLALLLQRPPESREARVEHRRVEQLHRLGEQLEKRRPLAAAREAAEAEAIAEGAVEVEAAS